MSGCIKRIRPYIINNELNNQQAKQKAGSTVFPEVD
jgi:hypothetical protein